MHRVGESVLTLLLALQIAATSGHHGPSSPASGDSAIRARVDSTAHAFLRHWRLAWQATQDLRRSPYANDAEFQLRDERSRGLAVHCHWPSSFLTIRRRIILGAIPAHASCPMWYPRDEPAVADERRSIDAGLSPTVRLWARQLRYSLRSLLDSAAQQLPGDMSITRHRVRFALDDDDLAGAARAAAACRGDFAHCGLLHGLVLYRVGAIAAADSAFLVAVGMMRDDERCRWNDVGALLEAGAREAYEAMPCAARADTEARVWWLSDPLYVEPGNERRAEHFARKVLLLLLAHPAEDERQHLQARYGGDNVAETLVRYGWPSHMYWAGLQVDLGHDNWLTVHRVETAPPYVVREYTRDRLHTVPRSPTFSAPFQAGPESWQLNAPQGDDDWWPDEHFARDRSRIVQLPLGQTVMLPRRGSTRFVWAGDIDSDRLGRADGDSVDAHLFESRAVSDVVNVQAFRARAGSTLIIDAGLQGGPALIGIEVPGDSSSAAARTRFGDSIPDPLSTLAGAKGVSQPLLLDPPADAVVALDADGAVSRMYGTTTFTGLRRVGVYWEAYGFPATDSVENVVRISREDRPGVLSRIAAVFRLGGETVGSMGLRWSEARGNSRAIHRMEGNVPVQMRSIVLDISSLPPGTYRIGISLNGTRGSAVSRDRQFVLR